MTALVKYTLLAVSLLTAGAAMADDWPQWGGSGRNFHVGETNVSAKWPASGLQSLWSRPLGEGYSAIAVVGGRLYTQYSVGETEFIVALSATDGTELWSHRHDAARPEGMRLNYGQGPHATPLVAYGRVFAVSTTGQLVALDAVSGDLIWRHDLWSEYGGSRLRRGYGASPIAWADTVIVPVGGEAPGMIAFAQADGSAVWRSEPFDSAQSSPILMDVDGVSQLVQFTQAEILGLDPDRGSLLWRHPHKVTGPYNVSTPVAGPGNTVFVSSSYGGGSRMLRLARDQKGTSVEELWSSKRIAIHFTNAIRLGDRVVASTGRSGVFAAALEADSGELAWRSRSIGRANYIKLGGRFLALEADGRLMLGELDADGPVILAETQLLESQSWTVPTLVGDTLYVRDRERILAVRLPLETSADRPHDPGR